MITAALLEELIGVGPVTLTENKDGSVTATCKPKGEAQFSGKGSDVIAAIGSLHEVADFTDESEGE